MKTMDSLLSQSLRRIELREHEVGAWVYLKSRSELEQEPCTPGVLSGVPVGVKDIFDTVDMPTTWGTSYLRVGRSPIDSAAVGLLRRAGAVLPGKTVSTELAYFTPGKTRNPHDLARTPGASSSGSAAAVADGMVPLALGTQTAGSVIRPAAYCGVIGFKPSFDVVSTSGVKAFSRSLDTVGWFSRTIGDAAILLSVLGGRSAVDLAAADLRNVRIAFVPHIDGLPLSGDVAKVLKNVSERLCERVSVLQETDLARSYTELVELQKTVMAYEAARTLVYEYDHFRERMGRELVTIVEFGSSISCASYFDALEQKEAIAAALESGLFRDFDAVLAPAVVDEAPPASQGTGDPVYCRGWTLLGNPCMSLPLGTGSHSMPIGVQLIGRKRDDEYLLGIANEVMEAFTDEQALPNNER